HPGRGKTAMDDMGVLTAFTAAAVHDAFAPYDRYTSATHALCNAHLLRELVAVADHHEQAEDTPGPDGWCWAQQVTDALLTIKKAVDQADIDTITADLLTIQSRLIRHGALIGAAATAGQQGRTMTPGPRPANRQTPRRLPTLRHRPGCWNVVGWSTPPTGPHRARPRSQRQVLGCFATC
ncbi:MAG: transposase, partial [Actinomycetales bacterium]|nr:transposase [Actinomycetales bacterium]